MDPLSSTRLPPPSSQAPSSLATENNWIKADRGCDYVPGLSIISNLVDIGEKISFQFRGTASLEDRYYKHIKDKSIWRCLACILLPGISNIVFAIYDVCKKPVITKTITELFTTFNKNNGLIQARTTGHQQARNTRTLLKQTLQWGEQLLSKPQNRTAYLAKIKQTLSDMSGLSTEQHSALLTLATAIDPLSRDTTNISDFTQAISDILADLEHQMKDNISIITALDTENSFLLDDNYLTIYEEAQKPEGREARILLMSYYLNHPLQAHIQQALTIVEPMLTTMSKRDDISKQEQLLIDELENVCIENLNPESAIRAQDLQLIGKLALSNDNISHMSLLIQYQLRSRIPELTQQAIELTNDMRKSIPRITNLSSAERQAIMNVATLFNDPPIVIHLYLLATQGASAIGLGEQLISENQRTLMSFNPMEYGDLYSTIYLIDYYLNHQSSEGNLQQALTLTQSIIDALPHMNISKEKEQLLNQLAKRFVDGYGVERDQETKTRDALLAQRIYNFVPQEDVASITKLLALLPKRSMRDLNPLEPSDFVYMIQSICVLLYTGSTDNLAKARSFANAIIDNGEDMPPLSQMQTRSLVNAAKFFIREDRAERSNSDFAQDVHIAIKLLKLAANNDDAIAPDILDNLFRGQWHERHPSILINVTAHELDAWLSKLKPIKSEDE
ncbi:MAG: hypothetical protein HY860_00185 [Chlamydiales bacterium]|nr:hypothetical protein [Chlamydiales bacterium]